MTMGPILLACLLVPAQAAVPAVDSFIPDRVFSIPIKIDEARRADIQRLELQVSFDEGKNWEQAGSVSPEATKFDYTAQKGDGIYWFSVGMFDKQGNRDPVSPYVQGAPLLKVYVDTVKPQANLLSAVRDGDQIAVQWTLQEQFPDPVKSRLEYRTEDMARGVWNPAPVLNFNPIDLRASFRPPNNYAVSVRLHVEDRAGNVAEPLPIDVPGGTPPAPSTFVATGSGSGTGQNPGPPSPSPYHDPGWGPGGPRPPAQQPIQPSPPLRQFPDQNLVATGGGGIPIPQAGSASAGMNRGVVASTSAKTEVVRTGNTTTPPPPPPSSGQRAPGAPASPQLCYSNSTQVFLDYRVGQVGLSGVSEVQVYITQDEGENWQPWSRVQHVGQPTELDPSKGQEILRTLQVDLPGEGVYGLYLVVKSGVGKCKPPPTPRTPPQIRFEVDLTKPEANLFEPDIVPDKKDSVVLIWEAHDRNLTAAPIAIEWAEHPNGPWNGIGPAELPNTPSRYVWNVPEKVPAMVYLRLRVRDRAGNVGVAQTAEPVNLDLNTPVVNGVAARSSLPGDQGTPQPNPVVGPHGNTGPIPPANNP
jgi:hypothetical protein